MRGVVLAGGSGSRLAPLTDITNKHLLPIYDEPMIYYPFRTLAKAGIKEVMVVVSGTSGGDFIRLLKNGEEFGFDTLQYAYQNGNGGIADALMLAKNFCQDSLCAVILGDNTTDADLTESIINYQKKDFATGPKAHVFLKDVDDPERYGVADVDGIKVISIEEKPRTPKTDLAVTGLYLYDKQVWDFINKCSPSKRGELEITDVNNFYIKHGNLSYSFLNGFWKDAGTFESLFEAGEYWRNKKNGVLV